MICTRIFTIQSARTAVVTRVCSRQRPRYRIGRTQHAYIRAASSNSTGDTSGSAPNDGAIDISRTARDLEDAAAAVSDRAYSLIKGYTRRRDWSTAATSASTSAASTATASSHPSSEVFCTTSLNMGEIGAIGFDYDYTLATYRPALQHLIYDLAKSYLLQKAGYPSQLQHLQYDEDFAVRGLLFDRRTGLMLKLSFAHRVTPGQAYLGRRKVTDAELEELYGAARHVSEEYMRTHMTYVNDLFSLSSACLLSDVVQLALDADIPFDPFALQQDVREAISYVHTSGVMHGRVAANPAEFLVDSPRLRTLLDQFRSSGKELFLLTNSSFPFVDAGLKFLIGNDWRDLFDIIITNARKPAFYKQGGGPFRRLDSGTNSFVRWHALDPSEVRNRVLVGGSVDELCRLADWEDSNVLYFGDHLHADLREPRRARGWYTGGIIPEIEDEIRVMETPEFQALQARSDAVKELLWKVQSRTNTWNDDDGASSLVSSGVESSAAAAAEEKLLDALERERLNILHERAKLFNNHFGSIFRAHGDPSAYGFEVVKGCNIYTTGLENLLNYSTNHRFYPRKRNHFPHEHVVS